MGLLDIKTLAILALVLHLALALVMCQTYATRKTYPGFRSWTLGLICWVLGSAAFFSREVIGEAPSILLSNPLYFLSGILIHNGLARFYGLKNSRRGLAVDIAVAGVGLCIIYGHFFIVNNTNARVFVNSLVIVFILVRAGLEPLLIPRARRNSVQVGISLSLWLMAALLFIRAVTSMQDPQYSSMQLQDPMLKVIIVLGLFSMVVIVFGFISLVHLRLEEELLEAQSRLQELANTDVLTGLVNRRGFTEIATYDLKLARRYEQKMSLIIFDLDHFKMVNDTHGHAVGDEVLAAIGQKCLEIMRDVDTLARWGGEEFAVLMPQTGLEGARQTAERLRVMVGSFEPVPGVDIRTTASFGVAELNGGSFEDMVERADACLYQAKREGRDRVCVAA